RGQEGALDRRGRGALGTGQTSPARSPVSSPEKARSRPAPPVTNTDVVDKPGWLRARLWIDLRESSAAALLGCGAFAAIDYAATLWAAPAGVRLATALRLVFLELTLAALLLCLVAPLFCAATVAV